MSGIQVNDAYGAGDFLASSHRHMKLVARVREYRPIAMYSCQMTGTKLTLSGYSPQRLHSGPN
ncbi:hypothetical protein M405DRAFT_818051 [Rhizopogon salebrosus TDB-379]|nr:hypothetical protein M405DRAFT_818051 [Rhizopogon salebrosus TDB-379]